MLRSATFSVKKACRSARSGQTAGPSNNQPYGGGTCTALNKAGIAALM